MKKNTLIPLLALCCWLFSPNLTKGQLYPPDYASVNVGLMDHHPAIIRKASDTSALVYYYDYNFRKVSLH